MSPKQYYEEHFREDFNLWIQTTDAHQHEINQTFIPIHNLSRKNLAHIEPKLIPYFIYSLAFTTLIDQIMFTYFRNDYSRFKSLTDYPKLEYGITNVIVYPWRIAQMAGTLNLFESFCEFFIKDYEEFFNKYQFNEANWNEVKNKLLNDKDVKSRKFGEVFTHVLSE